MTRSELTKGFFNLIDSGTPVKKATKMLAAGIIESKKTAHVDLVMADITDELEKRGHSYAKVTSAHNLSSWLAQEITTMIKSETGAKTVEINNEVDASLLGGAVIETGEQTYDFSIRGKLNALRNGVK